MKYVCINDSDTKNELPVHVIIGAGDYTKTKSQERARVGEPEKPIAELTKLSWVINFPGRENYVTKLMTPKTSVHDYKICGGWRCRR